jgi:hypothetical protein
MARPDVQMADELLTLDRTLLRVLGMREWTLPIVLPSRRLMLSYYGCWQPEAGFPWMPWRNVSTSGHEVHT